MATNPIASLQDEIDALNAKATAQMKGNIRMAAISKKPAPVPIRIHVGTNPISKASGIAASTPIAKTGLGASATYTPPASTSFTKSHPNIVRGGGGIVGAGAGFLAAGPPGAIVGAVVGLIGGDIAVKKL